MSYQEKQFVEYKGKTYFIDNIPSCFLAVLYGVDDMVTYYNCIDSRGKKISFFEVFGNGEIHLHKKRKWLLFS